ncbi:hypothetical protein LCGC14_2291830, partial [marine sediment metagenome]
GDHPDCRQIRAVLASLDQQDTQQ